ncbi:MAG TPA: IclR family transcriptional regulator [Candidatus Limnocylindrales bacterium]|nr:IclR family transcriptional regulator [Candidatus Limnocylindrales bacterium]
MQSIERAFAVLTALADGPIGVTDVALRVGVPKSTAARLLTALWHEGAVEQEAGGTRYRLGPRIADLATRHVPTRDLVAVARPHLEELATGVGEVAGLSVPDGRVVHYVDQVGTAHEVQVRDWTGSRVPMHAVPSGQVMLAGLAPAALDRFLATPLESFTPATITDAAELRERLAHVKIDGYAWVRDEFSEGLASVAAPIRATDGDVLAAVHVHGPSYRFPASGTRERVTERVVRAASRISAELRTARPVDRR